MILTTLSLARRDHPGGRRSPRTRAEARFCYYPCPCGWFGDPVKERTCSHSMVSRYQSDPAGVRRIIRSAPGPHRPTARPTSRSPESRPARKPDKKLSDDRPGELSALLSQRTGVIRQRVEAARERQRRRFEGSGGMLSNAGMGAGGRRPVAGALSRRRRRVQPPPRGDAAVAHERPGLQWTRSESAGSSNWRGPSPTWPRRLRSPATPVARDSIQTAHLAEAIQYRPRRQS
jgi:hypothetical protein